MRYADTPLNELYVDEELKEFAGSGNCVDPRKIQKDIVELEKRLRPIATWVDKKVVHIELCGFNVSFPSKPGEESFKSPDIALYSSP